MKLNRLEIVLVLAILIGGYLALQTGREKSGLQAEQIRLQKLVGDLEIRDRKQLYVRRLPTGDSHQFAWRMYVPPAYKLTISTSAGTSGTSSTSFAYETIGRIRFRESERGFLQAYVRFRNGASQFQIGDPTLAMLVREHWDELLVEQLGSADTAELDPLNTKTSFAPLLRLSFPNSLAAEAKAKLSPPYQKLFPQIFELRIGP